MSQGIDIGAERTPPNVAAMKSFKEKLLQGHKVTASQFGIELPVMTIQDNVAYRSTEDEEQEVDLETESNTMDEEYAPIDEDEPADASSTFISSPRATGKTKDPLLLLSDWLNHNQAKEELKIVGPFGKIGFKALNVSITDYGVAFIIKKDAIQFEPNINTELTIQYRGQDYSVIYAGGFFTFPKIPFTFVSFLRIQND